MNSYSVALAGNPNVGKSTIFNALTGMRQHTGNWTGKTVERCDGVFYVDSACCFITDLPGAYSLSADSKDEAVTADCLKNGSYDCVVIILDAGAPERNLRFALEVLALGKKAVICLNLTDEAEKKGVHIDAEALSNELGIPVVKCCAVKKRGINELKSAVKAACEAPETAGIFGGLRFSDGAAFSRLLNGYCDELLKKCVSRLPDKKARRDRLIDRLLTSKATGIPAMLLLCGVLFWITVAGANYPSEWLNALFDAIKTELVELSLMLNAPKFLSGIMIDGMYSTLGRVTAVMLPPMAIFFPLFSLLEDSGYMPRIAFNLDRFFSGCGAHGKQSLCMMMGIGCNACGVTGCRIIENDKERLIAILTNNFMPCNGRLPILIAVMTMYSSGFSGTLPPSLVAAAGLIAVTAGCAAVTLLISKLLSAALKSESSCGFVLELPPYRKPRIIKTLVCSFRDKTLAVLKRAAAVAAPAGTVIWLLANIKAGDVSVLKRFTDFLDPFGRFLGLDGVIAAAFILGFPANETVIPIIIMCYLSGGTIPELSGGELFGLLTDNGWTVTTAVCMMIMTVMHFPCSTTCLTIKKETGSIKWTLLSMAIPTLCGIVTCAAVSHLMGIFV